MIGILDRLHETGASEYQVSYGALKPIRPHYQKANTPTVKKTVPQNTWIEHLKRIQADQDQRAFAELFAHFAPRVKAFLMKSGASPSMAEECTQEVMATLWHKAHLFDPSRASVATWIFTIARNKKIDALRKQRRPEPENLEWGPEAEPEAADILVLQQESQQLTEAMTALPSQQRELIEKAYFGDLSHSEIAAETGLPLGTIKSRLRLALSKLRQTMK
jgi:RNA polymerase sigma-70 factor (ECF subfamily)